MQFKFNENYSEILEMNDWKIEGILKIKEETLHPIIFNTLKIYMETHTIEQNIEMFNMMCLVFEYKSYK